MKLYFFYRTCLLSNTSYVTLSYFIFLFNRQFYTVRLLKSKIDTRDKYKLSGLKSTLNLRYKKYKFITVTFNNRSSINPLKKSLRFLDKVSSELVRNPSNFKSYLSIIKYHSGCRPEKSLYRKSLKRFLRNTWLNSYKRGKTSLLGQLHLKSNPISNQYYTNRKYSSRVKYPSSFNMKYKKLRKNFSKRNRGKFKKSTFSTLMSTSKLFKGIYFRSKNTRRSLFSKKLFKTIKLSRGTFRLINQIRSKGKNRLIKSIKSLNHSTFYDRLLNFEMSALNILLKTSFVWSLNDARYIISNGYFFINGKLSRNPKEVITEGSRVQLPITNATYSWLGNKKKSLYKGYKKANRLRWYKNRVRSSRFRKRSYYFPKWLFKYALVGVKSPSLLEVDYTMLSAVLLYKPVHFNELNSPLWYYINIHAYSVYLWKYIN